MFWIIALIFGTICAVVANGKGRSAVGWFFIGFLFGLIALIIVCIISDIKEQESKEKAQKQENRRLREQLRQERVKGESFRSHAMARLDRHDEELQISTKDVQGIEDQQVSQLEQSGASTEYQEEKSVDAEPQQGYFFASCSQGHQFEVRELYAGSMRTCPSCYEQVKV
jgi:hypothetical protein